MAMNKDKIELPDLPRLISQTMGLQRFLKNGGQVKIDQYRGGHDNTINSAAEACLLALENEPRDKEILVL